MFELEGAILEWRRSFARGGEFDPLRIDELDDHLREAYATFRREGLDGEAAWQAALGKLGEAGAVAEEFAKIDRLTAIDRAAFALAAGLLIAAIAGLPAIPLFGHGRIASDSLLRVHVIAIWMGYMAGLAAAFLGGYAGIKRRLVRRPAGRMTASAMRWIRIASLAAAVLIAFGFVLGEVWAKREWGTAVDLSDFKETGALLAMACFGALSAAARRRTIAPGALLALAAFGGGVIMAAWFASPGRGNTPLHPLIGFVGLALGIFAAAIALLPGTGDRAAD